MPAPTTPLGWILALLDAVGSQPAGRAPRQCPAHVDAAPSLSLHERDGKLFVFCHAGCTWRSVLSSLACSGSVLHRPPSTSPREWAMELAKQGRVPKFPKLERGNGHPGVNGYRLEKVHKYGTHLLERWRHPVTGAKDLMWWTVENGARLPGLRGVHVHELPLYQETDVRAAMAMGEPIVLVESESSVDAIRGWAATTWAGSATSVPVQTLAGVLAGYAPVVYVADVDATGLACAAGLRNSGIATHVAMGHIGEDAKDLYVRLGPEGFRSMLEEVISSR